MPGTVTGRVRVDPGDWIIGEADGVIVVPQKIAMEALVKVEVLEANEQGMREDCRGGYVVRRRLQQMGTCVASSVCKTSGHGEAITMPQKFLAYPFTLPAVSPSTRKRWA